jgi:hypothetical protein
LAEKQEKLELESDGLGRWSNDSGTIPELDGAIDIDISATPFTNTCPSAAWGWARGKRQKYQLSISPSPILIFLSIVRDTRALFQANFTASNLWTAISFERSRLTNMGW